MYSTAYIILFLFYAVMALVYYYTKGRGRMWAKYCSIIVFIIFFGFRGFVGDDWLIYYPNFEGMYNDSIANIMHSVDATDLEPGFSLLQGVCKLIYSNYHFFIFVCCIINVVLLCNFFNRRVDNLPMAFMVFLCMSGIGLEINLLRNSISLLICLNALKYIPERKPIQYFALCALALSIHLSSIIFLPLYFFLHKRIPRWLYISIFLFSQLFYLLQVNFISPILLMAASHLGEIYVELIRNYIEGEMAAQEGVLSIGFLERTFTGVLIICYYDKLSNMKNDNVLFINAFILYILSFALLREFDVACRRIALLFVFSYWILWCDMFKCFAYRGNKYFYAFFILCYGLLKVNSMTNEPKFQYDNILFGSKSYEERYTIYMINKKK